MSAALLGMALRAPLPPDQKLSLLMLADLADERGLAWPTIDTMARLTGYPAEEAQAAIRALQAANVIAVNPNGRPSVGKPNQYLVRAEVLRRLSSRRAEA